MDNEDETTAYLKLFNEGTHNYLLHSSEDGLNDAFPVESIFTEIAPDWTSEGFPILLSGSLISDENNDSASTNAQLLEQKTEDTVTFFSNGDKNKLLLSNEVLLRVEDNNEENTITHVINGDTYSITYTQTDPNEHKENVEVIQLLNIDGSVTNINKDLLHFDNKNRLKPISSFYSQVQAHKCSLCAFLCENEDDIINHVKVKHNKEIQQQNGIVRNGLVNGHSSNTKMTSILTEDKKKYVLLICSTCGSGYSDKEDLKQHMIQQHKLVQSNDSTSEKKYVNLIKPSSDTAASKRKLITASLLKKQKTMRKFKCSIKNCPLRFEKDEYRKKHEECHVDQKEKQFMCPVCKIKFSIWRICGMHMWKSHSIDLDLLSCPICREFKAYSTVRVMTHMAIHNDEKPFICAHCGKCFKQINQLRNHEITHKSPEEVPDSFSKKKCQSCDQYFANSKSLKKHVKFVHDKFKPFICNICGHQTARKEMLQLHLRQHTGDKPFHCSYCEYKTADRNCLRKHTMRHFGFKKYSCAYCSYQSIQSSAFKRHMAKKHPGKEGTFSCDICKYTTINDRSFLSHMKCHELEKRVENVEDNESKSSDETQNFLSTEHSEDAVDTGGITIPAEFDLQLNQTSLI